MWKFVGQGWTAEWPSSSRTGTISKRRTKLTGVVGQVRVRLQRFNELEGAGELSKKELQRLKAFEEEKAKLEVDKKRKLQFENQSQMALATLSELSEKVLGKGFVELYGCTRCRHSRLGCITYSCNPHKYTKHREFNPDKYGDDGQLLDGVLSNISDKELIGGGTEALRLCVYIYVYIYTQT